jgi:hypothetical protein
MIGSLCYSEGTIITSRLELGTGNKSLKIVTPVTHSRLLDKASCVGASNETGSL